MNSLYRPASAAPKPGRTPTRLPKSRSPPAATS